jgi:GNAT superfamily N-acetyltransferase
MHELREGRFEEFFAVPFECYGRDSLYVSPFEPDLRRLLSRANPLFRENDFALYTVSRAGRPVGRLVAHVHAASNTRHRLARSYFGYFDCADDETAARILLDAAERWGRSRGFREIAGNFNLTAMQQMGVVTDGFDGVPYTDQMYNPPHLPSLLARCGYEPSFPMRTFEVDLNLCDPAVLMGPKQAALLAGDGVEWRRVTALAFRRLMRDACAVLNDGFLDNPLFVPLTEEEFFFHAREMLWIMDRRISVLAYQEGRPIGVVVCIPDLNPFLRATGSSVRWTTPLHYLRHRLTRRRAVILFYSVHRAFHGRGLNGAMLARVVTAVKRAGYRRLGITWIADVNGPSLRQVEKLGARPLHRLHLFRKSLA